VDTDVLSDLRKGARANRGVRRWFAETDGRDLFTSVLVLGEIRRGIELIRRRDETAAIALEHWLARLSERFSNRVFPIDAVIADRWGALNVPSPLPMVDGLLVATALVHDLTLVTRNVRGLDRTGVRLHDPFQPERTKRRR
jgi:predicted nucleic acid-binding protein